MDLLITFLDDLLNQVPTTESQASMPYGSNKKFSEEALSKYQEGFLERHLHAYLKTNKFITLFK
jgi:hypothetical protein